MAEPGRIDRLPPNSPEAEQGVLGCILQDPNECMGQCIEKMPEGEATFYDLRHQTIYMVMVQMYDERIAIDLITLQQRLKDAQYLEECGGIQYIATLPDVSPSAANLPFYLEIVREKFLLRRLIQNCTSAIQNAYANEGDVEALMDQAESDMLSIRRNEAGQFRRSRELMPLLMEKVQTIWENRGQTEPGGIPTGFSDYDRMTDGLHEGEMIVIAARPSAGKTSLAMNIAEYVSLNLKLPVGVFSLEMTAEAIMQRAICSQSRTSWRDLRDGFLTESDVSRIQTTAGRLSAAPLFIDDTGGLSIMQLRAKARRLFQREGIKLFVIDYLQLLHSTSRKAQDNRASEVAEISGGIKALAKELKVPIIVLSQLNRLVEQRADNKPKLSELRESGAIEQDADTVALLYKPTSEKETENDNPVAQRVNLLIAKQRNGPIGEISLVFLRNFTRFETAAKAGDETQEQMPV